MQAPLPLSLQASVSQTIRGILSNKVEYLPQVWSYKLLYKSFCELSSSAIFCEIIFPEIWNSSVINLFSQTFSPALCCDPGYYNGEVSKLIIPGFFCVLFFSFLFVQIFPYGQVERLFQMGQGAISPSLMVLFLQEVRKGCGCPNERLFTVLVSTQEKINPK